MNIGTIVFGGASGVFGASLTLSVNFGSGADRALVVDVFNYGSLAQPVTSVVIDPAGANITMTAETQYGPSSTIVGNTGYTRRFRYAGSDMPTGTKNVVITATGSTDGVLNARAIPMDGVTAIAAGVDALITGTSVAVTVPSATGHVVLASFLATGVPDARSLTPVSPATLVKRVLVADNWLVQGAIVQSAGATSVPVTITASAGTTGIMSGWDLTLSGPAGPTLTSPTGSAASSTSASIGVSTDTASGTLYRYVSTNSTESAATIKASGTTSTVTAAGAQGPFTVSGLTSGLTYYPHFVHTASAVDSAVSSAGPIYPGTWRPASDVTVTGWTASTGSTMAVLLDEDTAGDGDYITSPTLSGTPGTAIMALSQSLPAGTYSIKVRAKTSSGAGSLTVTLLDGSNTSQGAATPQAIDATWTTYTLAVTTTGAASRIKLDVTG